MRFRVDRLQDGTVDFVVVVEAPTPNPQVPLMWFYEQDGTIYVRQCARNAQGQPTAYPGAGVNITFETPSGTPTTVPEVRFDAVSEADQYKTAGAWTADRTGTVTYDAPTIPRVVVDGRNYGGVEQAFGSVAGANWVNIEDFTVVDDCTREVCDGMDNDCDGTTDEGVLNACGSCGPVPQEVCDGMDNDCDGTTDEGCVRCSTLEGGACSTGQQGTCAAGAYECQGGTWDDPVCVRDQGPSSEVCDGRDNDCDGTTDENVRNACGGCGPVPQEVCDGQDNDCDGTTDENVSNACGGCGPVPQEVCDGQDNDCDGMTDEGCVRCSSREGGTCMTGQLGVCTTGTYECQGGTWDDPVCVPDRGPSSEVCDGLDNDCDGNVDENLSGVVECGEGACAHEVQSCLDGDVGQCDPLLGSVAEICDNGVDDDCNGRTDEGCEECLADGDCDDGDPCTDDLCSADDTCTSVAVCASPQVCVAGACMASDQGEALGGACDEDGQCASGRCVDGVCCESGCDDACVSCLGALTGAEDGTCAPISAGTDPDEECDAEGEASCGTDGLCDGQGACRLYVEGTVCSADGCSSASSDAPDTCDGRGSCVEREATPCEPGYACVGFACREQCASDADCVATHHCVQTECVPDLPRGEACEADGQCRSNQCVDGVCCDAPCGGTCRACTAALKGYGADGICEPVAQGFDSENECRADSAVCGATGQCDGMGACQRYAPPSTPCGTTQCAAGEVAGSLCDGTGRCRDDSIASCGAFVCDGDACADTCTADDGCVQEGFCNVAQTCSLPQPTGTSCTNGAQCETDLCVDQFCCTGACEGQCEACDSAGLRGSCVPVTGAPHGEREACAGGYTVCAGLCNGSQTDACVYPGSLVACGADDTCDNGTILAPLCDGSGGCGSVVMDCAPFQCTEALMCRTECESGEDCVEGSRCESGQCTAVPVGRCVDDNTLLLDSGETVSCFAYRCAAAACLDACQGDDDCAPGSVCRVQQADGDTSARGVCTADFIVPDPPSGGGGCALSPAGSPRQPWAQGLLALLAVLAAVRIRRRRSC